MNNKAPDIDGAAVDEIAILQEQEAFRAQKTDRERFAVLRVYNYFRIVVSFLLFIVFFEVPDQTIVGTLEPRWFQLIALTYLSLNIIVGLTTLIVSNKHFANPNMIGSIVVLDILFITLLLLTSGGVDSGLGLLLVFTVAFGSVMITRQQSLVFPAIATVNSISVELYLDATGAVFGNQHYFEVAILGATLFVVNLFFQYVSRLLAEREQEVVSLETLDRMHRIAEQSRRALEVANARFNALLRSTREGVIVVDGTGTITFANELAGDLLSIDHTTLIDENIRRFFVPRRADDDISRRNNDLATLIGADPNDLSGSRWRTAENEEFLVDFSFETSRPQEASPTDIVLLFRNVTQERENEDRVQYLANHDELTGLANRANFKELLQSTVSRARRSERGVAILLVDSDHFTVVNEERGQAVGDTMLRTMAERLTSLVREGDLVARLYGDQFAVMLADLDRDEDAAIVAEKINEVMTQPILAGDASLETSVSIGISVLSKEHANADEMISAATSAMEIAKSEGRNTYRFYQADMQRKADDKKRIQMMLRAAIDHDEFKLMFQPIVSIQESRIYSSEALIRWFPREADPVRPDIFIPVAEESGQIQAIGQWVLNQVVTEVQGWQERVGYFPSVAINVSSKQLKDAGFREQFETIIRTKALPIEIIEMELTETGVMEDPEVTLAELNQLRDLGVKISIDDFGTGYSSLDYLRRLPLDILKIDQSFTRGIGSSENDEEIVRVMIRMAHAMGLRVICEGVETEEHLKFLQQHNCDFAQGYFFSKPRSAEELIDLLIREKEKTLNIMTGEAGH